MIEESDIEQKVYTNKRSEELLTNSRPALRIEDSLIIREEKRKERLKRLEESMYDRPNIPEITERASRLKPKADLLTRLYHQPVQKKLNETQSSSTRSMSPALHMDTKKRPFSPLGSPVYLASGFESKRRPQTTKSRAKNDQFASERSLRNNNSQETMRSQKISSIHEKLTKKTLPFGQNSTLEIDVPESQEKSLQSSQTDYSLSTKRIAPNFQNGRSNLPNMLFFGGQKDPLNEKFSNLEKSIAKQALKATEGSIQNSSLLSQTDNFIKQAENDNSSVSKDSSQVVRIQANKSPDEYKRLAGFSLHERNQVWLQQKNKRIESQQQRKKAKELEGCTFQPTLYKKPAPKKLEIFPMPISKPQLLVQIPATTPARRINTPAHKPVTEEQNLFKERASTPKEIKEVINKIQTKLPPRAVNVKIHIDEHRNHFNIYNVTKPGTLQKTIYNDLEKQKKLIDYILDSEKLKASSQKPSS